MKHVLGTGPGNGFPEIVLSSLLPPPPTRRARPPAVFAFPLFLPAARGVVQGSQIRLRILSLQEVTTWNRLRLALYNPFDQASYRETYLRLCVQGCFLQRY